MTSPHALFVRIWRGQLTTIEINARTPSGVRHISPAGEVQSEVRISIRQGPAPFWAYETGHDRGPNWHHGRCTTFTFLPDHKTSYVGLLRRAVAILTGAPTGPSYRAPRLGFWSRYHTARRGNPESWQLGEDYAFHRHVNTR